MGVGVESQGVGVGVGVESPEWNPTLIISKSELHKSFNATLNATSGSEGPVSATGHKQNLKFNQSISRTRNQNGKIDQV